MSRTLNLPNLFLSPESPSLLSPLTPSSPTSVRLPSPTTTVRAFTATETPTRRRTCNNNGNSLYEVLRVKRNASQAEIKTAYRTLAKRYHPDACSELESENDGLDFIAIHNAYATLSDPASRASYDLSLGPRYSPSSPSSYHSSYYSYSSSSSSGLGFYATRRWESDQCW